MSDVEQYEPLEHAVSILEKVAADYRALRAENEKLRAALKPFADRVKDYDPYAAIEWNKIGSDLRAAAAALKEMDG